MDLYLLKDFNNYFNRKVIKLSTLQEYLDSVGEDNYFVVENTNFNPNDGVSTTHVIGSANHPFNKDWQPDYALLINWPDGGAPRIVSRWFVTESSRTMANKYTVALKRDSVVDYFDQTFSAPCFIKKGYLAHNDPFIINNEGIEFNQIKTKELYLKDESKVPWAVVYLARDRTQNWNVNAKYFPSVDGYFDDPDDPNYEELQEIYAYLEDKINATSYKYLKKSIGFTGKSLAWRGSPNYNAYSYTFTVNNNNTVVTNNGIVDDYNRENFIHHSFSPAISSQNAGFNDTKNISANVNTRIMGNFYTIMQPLMTNKGLLNNETQVEISDTLMNKWNNKIIASRQTGKMYKILFSNTSTDFTYSNDIGNIMYNQFNAVLPNYPNWLLETNTAYRKINVTYTQITRTYQLSELIGSDITLTIPQNTYQTQECTFDILAFPLFNTRMTLGNEVYDCLGSATLNIVSAIKTQLGDFCYDVQILPFAPFQNLIDVDTNQINLSRAYSTQFIRVNTITSSPTCVSVGIFAPYAHFTFDITKLGTSIYNDDEVTVASETTITNRKVQSNTDMWRLSSPNYASQFEFNVAKMVNINGGTNITKFNVDCTYRPHNPYIKINPDFGFLYGQDFNDARGLICSGDFGITTMSDAWVNYQIQNKNYQNMFDRQIQNMETNRAIAREQEQWNVTKASVGAGVGLGVGTLLGGLVRGGVGGAILGGITGGVSSGMNIAGAVKQQGWNERAYQEQRAFSTDMFNMQMDNIKALPQSITHTSSLSLNFKFYPVLEYYTCTDEEKRSLEKKIQYNGMTVGRLGDIKSYVSFDGEAFIQGEIIRLENIGDDSHLAQDIYNEVNKGLFIEQQTTEVDFIKKDTTTLKIDNVDIGDKLRFKKTGNDQFLIQIYGRPAPTSIVTSGCTARYYFTTSNMRIESIDPDVGLATIEFIYNEEGK